MSADSSLVAVFDGATVRRVVDRSHAHVRDHSHDWPVLSVFVLGGYLNRTEVGEAWLNRPSAILYRAGARHENVIGENGFEQFEIEFDPDWLGNVALPDSPACRWEGAGMATPLRVLAGLCSGIEAARRSGRLSKASSRQRGPRR